MTCASSAATPLPLPEGRFSGPTEFSGLIRQALAAAAAQGWREIIWCDPDFADWPLGERLVAQSLNDWARTGRRLTLLARHYDAVTRRHARFVTFRQTWAHLVECRRSAAAPAGNLPSAFWSPAWIFERLDMERSAGVAGFAPERRIALRARLNECLGNSSAGFPATILGL